MTSIEPLVLIGFNLYVGNKDSNVREALTEWSDRYHPHAYLLSECRPHRDVLGHIPGYEQYQAPLAPPRPGTDVSEQGDTAILLQRRLVDSVRRSHTAHMRKQFKIESHNKVHEPRTAQVLRMRLDGWTVRLRASHWPTLGFNGPNREAFAESAKRSRRWLRAGLLATSLDVGDLNDDLPTVAHWFGDGYTVEGGSPDMLIGRNVGHVESERIPDQHGSDHHGRVYRVWPKRSKR